jgi:hypothetical protein
LEKVVAIKKPYKGGTSNYELGHIDGINDAHDQFLEALKEEGWVITEEGLVNEVR